MIGAIIGDIVGSRFEFEECDDRGKDFELFESECRFTDDSLMTLAVAKSLLLCKGNYDDLGITAIQVMRDIAKPYPWIGWGGKFYLWLFKNSVPYNSFGNGAGMRISPVGWVAETEEEVKILSKKITEISHNHPDGIKGAEAVAMAVYLARIGKDKAYIRERMSEYYPKLKDEYFTIQHLMDRYVHENRGSLATCEGSIPEAIVAFLDGENFEDVIRNAVCIGGDSDTLGAMAGSIAEAYYDVPIEFKDKALLFLPDNLQKIYRDFSAIKKEKVF